MSCGCNVVTAKIDSGGTTSEGIDLGVSVAAFRLQVPTINTATIGFETSADGVNWATLWDKDGAYAIASSSGDMQVLVKLDGLVRFLKVTTSAAQSGGDRTFAIYFGG